MSPDSPHWPWRDDPRPHPSSTATPSGASWSTPGGGRGEFDEDILRQRLEASIGMHYAIGPVLGRGGMAVVFLATERSSVRQVALKVLRGDLVRDAELRARFEREAAVTMQLRHPNLVATYQLHSIAPRGLVLVLEYVGGGTLRDRLQGGMAVEDVLRIFGEVAAGLAHAHEHGVVHRDIKPENVLIDAASGAAKLGDFGIARIAGSDTLTMTGSMLGTPAYMSPEQIEGGRVGASSDVYSLGLVAWAMLAGERPWAGETEPYRIMKRQVSEALPSLAARRPGVPDGLLQVIGRCTEKRPSARFADATEVHAAILAVSGTHRSGRRTTRTPTPATPVVAAAARVEPSSSGARANLARMMIGAGLVTVAITIILFLAADASTPTVRWAPAADTAAAPSPIVSPLGGPSTVGVAPTGGATQADAVINGTLEVAVNTPATIVVTNVATGVVQLRRDASSVRAELPSGEYDVVVQHEFAGREATRIRLDANRRYAALQVTFPLEGALAVTAASGYATVSMDGRELGETPLQLTGVAVGRYTLQYRWPDGQTSMETIVIRGGQETRVTPSPVR